MQSMNLSTLLIGNELFRCPEHETDEVCPKGDIWSFATLILYMLSSVNSTTPFYLIQPVSRLHDRVREMLSNKKDEWLRDVLIQMIVTDPKD